MASYPRENLISQGWNGYPGFILAGALEGQVGAAFDDAALATVVPAWLGGPGRNLVALVGDLTTATKGDLAVYNGSVWELIPAGDDGHILKSNGPGELPDWTPAAIIAGQSAPVVIVRDPTTHEITGASDPTGVLDNFVHTNGLLSAYDENGVTRTIARDSAGRVTGVV
jgi:hypothetical protein